MVEMLEEQGRSSSERKLWIWLHCQTHHLCPWNQDWRSPASVGIGIASSSHTAPQRLRSRYPPESKTATWRPWGAGASDHSSISETNETINEIHEGLKLEKDRQITHSHTHTQKKKKKTKKEDGPSSCERRRWWRVRSGWWRQD